MLEKKLYDCEDRARRSSSNLLGCLWAYKPYAQLQIDGAHNSQGREQMHSVLEKLAPSLRQMNYSNFMRTLIIFFSVHNLWTMDKL